MTSSSVRLASRSAMRAFSTRSQKASSFSQASATGWPSTPVWKSKFYGAFVLNHRVVLHAIDATRARWRGDAGSSPLDRARTAASSPRNELVKNCRVNPMNCLISTQLEAHDDDVLARVPREHGGESREEDFERRRCSQGHGREGFDRRARRAPPVQGQVVELRRVQEQLGRPRPARLPGRFAGDGRRRLFR